MRRLVTVVLLAGLTVLALVPAWPAPAPMLIAHRGGADLWPENTMSAFRNAHALFTDAGVPGWIELDVQFTSDGVLVVMHDATLDRTTNCTGPVVEKPAAEVAACDADPDPLNVEPVPTVAQVLAEGRNAGWRLVIEIKNIPGEPGFDVDCNELAGALDRAVDEASFPREALIVQSFWPLCLDGLSPATPKLLLTSSTTVNEVSPVDLPVPLGITLTANALFATLRGYEYSAPDQDAFDLVAPVVDIAHLLGRKVVVWTVDDAARMADLARIGVDGLISNRPDLLISTLG